MKKFPRISIITCSYNQGKFIERTIQSVLTQNYPDFEHIIIDGMSTDNTQEILALYPHLITLREPDKGQADAINKGFAIATGDIICFLNSDDTFTPDALNHVAKNVDPTKNRHIIMGRCRFIDEYDVFLGIEHPSYFENHRRVLQIWKGHGIPQPAVFWSREVLQNCGGLNTQEQLVLDYDLFCRFSKKYNFHCIPEVLANYRLHANSKTNNHNDASRLTESIRVSKRYWGPPWHWFYWRLSFSLINYRRKNYAEALLLRAKKSWSLWHGLFACLIGLDRIYFRILHPWLKNKVFINRKQNLEKFPQIMAYRDYRKIWPDQWVGPHVFLQSNIKHNAHALELKGYRKFLSGELTITLIINNKKLGTYKINNQHHFTLTIPLNEPLLVGPQELQIISDQWFIMHDYVRNEDYIPRSFKLEQLNFI